MINKLGENGNYYYEVDCNNPTTRALECFFFVPQNPHIFVHVIDATYKTNDRYGMTMVQIAGTTTNMNSTFFKGIAFIRHEKEGAVY